MRHDGTVEWNGDDGSRTEAEHLDPGGQKVFERRIKSNLGRASTPRHGREVQTPWYEGLMINALAPRVR